MHCTRIWNIAKRGIRDNTRSFCILRKQCSFDTKLPESPRINSLLLGQEQHNLCIIKRFAHKNNKHTSVGPEESSDDDSDYEDSSEEESSDEELSKMSIPVYLQTPDAITRKFVINSRRLDAICKGVFNISRKKIETLFYNSMIRVNDELQPKKSIKVNPEDQIDIIIGPAKEDDYNMLFVRRAFIYEITDVEDEVKVKAIMHKRLLIENYENPWNPVKISE